MSNFHLRWMIRKDMPRVLEIENESFGPESAWSENDFAEKLRQRNCIGMVAEAAGKVEGFFVYELHKGKIELTNIAVAFASRRTGIGRSMIDKLASKLDPTKRTVATAILRESNLSGHQFFRAVGWRCVTLLRREFDKPIEDGYRFDLRIAPQPAHQFEQADRLSGVFA